MAFTRNQRSDDREESSIFEISKRSIPKIAPSCFTSPKKNYFYNRIWKRGIVLFQKPHHLVSHPRKATQREKITTTRHDDPYSRVNRLTIGRQKQRRNYRYRIKLGLIPIRSRHARRSRCRVGKFQVGRG